MEKGDIFYPTLSINLKKGIPQIGDKTWMNLKEGKAECMILSIESVQYNERLKIDIKYKAKLLDIKNERINRNIHAVK